MKGDRLSLVNQQVIRYTLERQAARARGAAGFPAVQPVITVSRLYGSGGTEIARRVADRLGYALFDREIIEAVSREAGVQQIILDALDERTRSSIEQWMDGVLHQSILSANEFVAALGRTLITLSRLGSAVIVGRGANFLLEHEPSLHVRVVASEASRIESVMRTMNMSRDAATDSVHTKDRERRGFVEKYLHRNIDDATAYHLVLNTDRLPPHQCVDLVQQAYGQTLAVVAGR